MDQANTETNTQNNLGKGTKNTLINPDKKILITSALPYVNNVPHLGNIIGCVLSADVFARYCRSKGYDCIYICGTDEYGTATETKALKEGKSPREICDKYYEIHKNIYQWFNISFDNFGRTSTPEQTKIAQDIFLKLYKNNYIFEDTIEQAYCEHDQRFLADRYVEGTCPKCGYENARGDQCDNCSSLLNPAELLNPKCSICGNSPVVKETKHLFLDLPKLKPQLESWIQKASKEGKWSLNSIKMTEAWLRDGLKPRAISRDLKWGIPIPLEGYEHKVFYVWFDAPIGYISITACYTPEWEQWWKNPGNVQLFQFMGKDNIPFHTVIFPASLIGTGDNYTLLHHINTTEYLNYEDGKFSKSRSIGVFGDDVINTGIKPDLWRYYLLVNRPEKSDTVFMWNDFRDKINNELVGNLGNFVNRVLVFINKYYDGTIYPVAVNTDNLDTSQSEYFDEIDRQFFNDKQAMFDKITLLLENVELKEALKEIMHYSRLCNKYFQDKMPWKQVKDDSDKCKITMNILANALKDLAIMIEPYTPGLSTEIFDLLNIEKQTWNLLGNDLFKEQHKVKPAKVIVQKLDDNFINELKQKYSGKQGKEKKLLQTNSNNTRGEEMKSDDASFEKEDLNTNNPNENSSEHMKSDTKFSINSLDLCVAEVIDACQHPNADKLIILKLNLGTEQRQIVAGLKQWYSPEDLKSRKIVIVANLKPAKLRGELSQGMLLAAQHGDTVKIIEPRISEPGDRAYFDDENHSQPNDNTAKEIDIKDFMTLDIRVKDKHVICDSMKLRTDKEVITIDIDDNAKVR